MYRIGTDEEVAEQVAALPDALLPRFREVLDLLEIAPWQSEPYNAAAPDTSMRVLTFGLPAHTALAVFLILEEDRRVEIVRVLWLPRAGNEGVYLLVSAS